MSRWVCLSALVFLCVSCGKVPLNFAYDSTVPADQRALIESDIECLAKTNITDNSEAEALGVSDFSANTLAKWLGLRVRYIVGESYVKDDRRQVAKEGTLPDSILLNFLLPSLDDSDSDAAKTITIMSNVGGETYLKGVADKKLYSLQVMGQPMRVQSPRVGIIKIGPGLFTRNKIENSDLRSSANCYRRLSTFFHEARHSDGNSKRAGRLNTGFPHALCPADHNLKNTFSCDKTKNGSYVVGRVILKKLTDQCTDCTRAESEALSLAVADEASRLLPGGETEDPTPEGVPQ